jgi:hypothetical protein
MWPCFHDAAPDQFMADINTLWGSNVQACDCTTLSGVNGFGECQGNAESLSLPSEIGYVFYDPGLLQNVALQTMSGLPSAVILAHETGHQLQYTNGLQYADNRGMELGADCFAGYFAAWAECARGANAMDIAAAFNNACLSGNSASGDPWYDATTHGTCDERVQAMMIGIQGYQTQGRPSLVCVQFQ